MPKSPARGKLSVTLLIAVLVVAALPGSASAAGFGFLNKWGANGSADGNFNQPFGIATSRNGQFVYVSECSGNRIQKFTAAGVFVTKWGSSGTGTTQFSCPYQVAVDSADNVYVADNGNHRVKKFSPTGTFLAEFGTGQGSGNGQLSGPSGVAVDAAGNVYVAEEANNRVQVFSSTGAFVRKWGGAGATDGLFASPRGLSIDAAGNLHVADLNNHRVQKFSPTGTFLGKFGSSGSGNGQFNGVDSAAISPTTGRFYVNDENNSRIQVFSATGAYISQFGTAGNADGQFATPTFTTVDCRGNLYVADYTNDRVQKFGDSASPAPPCPPPSTGTGGGGPAGGPGTATTLPLDITKPILSAAVMATTTFRAAPSGPSISAKRKARIGTKVSFRLSEPGSVKFTVDRKTRGRKVGKRCKAKTRKNRRKKACTRWVKVRGSFTVPGKAGKTTFTFRGRMRGKTLKPGSYRLNSQASDKARNKSRLRRKGFRIVK